MPPAVPCSLLPFTSFPATDAPADAADVDAPGSVMDALGKNVAASGAEA